MHGMLRLLLALSLSLSASAADLVLSGTWAGAKPELPAAGPVVLAMYDRNGTCCGGPAAALAGLANLRAALPAVGGPVLVAVDVTAGATPEQATAAASLHRTDGIPLLVDPARATAAGLGVTLDMTMTYVVRKADGGIEVVHSPAQVRRKLGT